MCNIRIETKRLSLYPISDEQIRDMIKNETDAGMKQAYGEMLQGCIENPEQRIWNAVWLMELKDSRISVGDFSFKGLSQEGMVEIGYGVKEEYRRQGYATEAVTAVSSWALMQQSVNSVEAEVAPDNIASVRVMEKSGYKKNGIIGKEGERYTYMKTFCKNPIIQNIYTADPAPMVYGDTLYLYTTHDEDELINDFYTMFDWRCYSTQDMVNWTDHGSVFSLDDISWADDRAWAPQTIERNGKFYMYCPVHKKDGGMAIAVGVADRPEGPFVNIGEPLVDEGDWNDIDPTVFIDDDGQAYLYFGNPELRYVKLNEDMISYDKSVGVVKIPMTVEAFGKGSHFTGTTYGEGPWFYKRNGLYYMVFAAFRENAKNESLAYSTSSSPTGPWTYGGVLMEESDTFTNHPGIADFKGHSYLFYHNSALEGGSLFHRSVCVVEFKYNEDGTIDTLSMCDGVEAID